MMTMENPMDDIVLVANSLEELQQLINELDVVDPKMNYAKTEVMSNDLVYVEEISNTNLESVEE